METEFQKVINYRGVDFECEIVDTAGQVGSKAITYRVSFLKRLM